MAVVGDAYIVVKAITTGFENDVRRAASGINLGSDGRAVGESFTKGFNNGISKGLGKKFNFSAGEADAARRAFQTLIRTNFALTASIGPLISSIGALGGGLVSLASSLLAAAPASVVFATALTSIGIAAVGLLGALKGVGAAISAGSKARKGSVKDTVAEEAAIKRVLSATRRLTEAQYEFAKATAAANEEIQQLGFDAEDAAIAEKKAAIELEKARETLQRVQDLPPNSRARREAQLAFAEAELNLRKSKDRNSDLRKEQERLGEAAKKAGTEVFQQTDTYLNAKQNEMDAVAELADAEKAQKAATADGAGDTAFADAMAGLSKEAQGFVNYIINTFNPALKELRDALGTKLFSQLESGLEKLRTKLFPGLKPVLVELGDSIGKSFGTIIDAITDIENMGDLEQVIKNAGINIESYSRSAANLYDGFLSILVSAQPLADKFNKFLEKKTAGWATYLDTKQATGELEKMFNKAGDIAAKIGTVLGNAFSGIINIVKANFTPGGGGYILLEYFKDVTEEFEKFSGSVAGQKTLSDYFKGAAENSKAILGSVGAFVKEILKVGADPNIKVFFDTLKEGAPVFGDILKSANEAGPSLARLVVSILKFVKATTDAGAIKVFFDTLNTVLTAINTLLENELVKNILNVIGRVLAFLLALGTIGKIGGFGVKVLSGNFQQLGKIMSAVLPAPVLNSIKSGFDTIKLKGMYAFDKVKAGAASAGSKILELGKAAGGKALSGIKTFAAGSMVLLTNPIFLIAAAVVAIIAVLVLLYKKVDWFREGVDKAFSFIKNAMEGPFNWLKENWPLVLAILTGPIGLAVLAVVKNFDEIVAFVKGLPGKLAEAGKAIWNWISDFFVARYETLKTNIGTFISFITGLPEKVKNAAASIFNWLSDFFVARYETLKANISTFISFIAGLPAKVRSAAAGLWDGLKDSFKSAINYIINKWNSLSFDLRFPDKIFGVPLGPLANKGFTLNTPDIPTLAKGGIIPATPGGTIARIGEAGRSERVEPLDPDGLSKRDKAMIKMLSGGGAGGMTVNVYPSPGMNESELASMVSRQIAFQLRRGGA